MKTLPLVLMSGGALLLMGNFMFWQIPENGRKYSTTFKRVERNNSMPRNLLARVAYQESRFRPEIINGELTSSAGAVGIMQIVPRWHPTAEPLNPTKSIEYAGEYLANLKRSFGTWRYALAAYNWGPGNMNKFLRGEITSFPKETFDYVSQISSDIQGI